MRESWQEVFESRMPEWLIRFDEAPGQALDELFSRRFFHGHLQAAEPEDLLIDWIGMLGETGSFTHRLDIEMRTWVEERWGGVPERRRVKRWADAWQCLANVVGAVDELPLTADALRVRFDQAREALGPFSTSPSRDPLGRYLWAVAGHQGDRSLETSWWSMCDLHDDIPFHHATYAIGGVAGLPPPPGEEGGGFRDDVVHAVLRLGRAFDRLISRRRLQSKQAAMEFGAALSWALAAFPFPDRWCGVLAPRLRNEPEWVRGRLVERVHGLAETVERAPRRPPVQRDWKNATDRLVTRLRREAASARSEAEKLLGEARALAETTGDSIPLNRALCRFSSTIAAADTEQAISWAEEAVAWEPWDELSWTTLMKALLRAGSLEEAQITSWRAVERFPHNVAARNGLGEVLKAAGKLDQAEAVFRDSVDRFPKDVVARNGLESVLKLQGKPVQKPESTQGSQAESGATLQETNAAADATLEPPRDPEQAPALGEAYPAEPVSAVSEVREGALDPGSQPDLRTRTARLFRRDARRAETTMSGFEPSPSTLRQRAEALLETVLAERPHDVRALTERGLLLLDSGDVEKARSLLDERAARLPAAPLLWASLARADREEARESGWHLDDTTERETLRGPEHLHTLDHAYEPLTRLQESRAYLALTDGDARLRGATRALDLLRRWVAQHQADVARRDFEPWYAAELQRYAFAPIDLEAKVEPTHVEAIAACIEKNARFVDTLEEEFALRFT